METQCVCRETIYILETRNTYLLIFVVDVRCITGLILLFSLHIYRYVQYVFSKLSIDNKETLVSNL